MTGQKNRFKFDDEDFNDPTHDGIIVKCLDPEYLESLLNIPEYSKRIWIAYTHPAPKRVSYDSIDTLSGIHRTINSEKPILRAKSILGYWDIVLTYHGTSKNYTNVKSLYFIEVKPKIDSFGRVLRQLKTYEVYQTESKGNIYLITPDMRYRDAFENQGIHVIDPYPQVSA